MCRLEIHVSLSSVFPISFLLSPYQRRVLSSVRWSSEYEGKKERERKETRVKYLWKRHIVIIFTLGEGSIVFLELRYVREGLYSSSTERGWGWRGDKVAARSKNRQIANRSLCLAKK